MMLQQKLRNKILTSIKPNKEEKEKIDNSINEFISILNKIISKEQFEIKIFIAGSYAKNTYIVHDFDVDIFFQFQKLLSDEKKSIILEKILKQTKATIKKEYGSRTYFSGIYSSQKNKFKLKYEAVPIDKKEIFEVENSTDLSIHHVNFVNSKTKKDSNLCDEIRLAKLWFKNKKLYGAESYIGGFSGHSIECLVIHFKSLENVIKFLSNAKENEIISMNVKWDLDEISKDKLSPIIIQDPIVTGRNALSALTKEIFFKAKYEAIQAIENNLEESDFKIKKDTLTQQKNNLFSKRNHNLAICIELEFIELELTDDVKGSLAKKICKKFQLELSKIGFQILKNDFIYNTKQSYALCKIEILNDNLSNQEYIKGPQLSLDYKIISQYLEKNKSKNIIQIGSQLYTIKNRNITSLLQFVKTFSLKKNYLNCIPENKDKYFKKIEIKKL